MIVSLSLDVGVCEEEDGEYDRHDVPAREYQSNTVISRNSTKECIDTQREDASARDVCSSYRLIHSRKGDHCWYLQKANLKSVSRPNFHTEYKRSAVRQRHTLTKIYLNAMFSLMAKDMAFMNSVVLGTSAKSVIPRNFSCMPDPPRTTSTISTRISVATG